MFEEKKTVLSITELTNLIKNNLESNFYNVTVEGEISNFRPSSTGHFYFSLKDKEALLSCCIFRPRINSIKADLIDGKKIKAYGSLSVYAPRGSYQLIIEKVEEVGNGSIQKLLEERKNKFTALGYFDLDKKKQIPSIPRVVGIVTSPTGAALHDIINITNRRNSGLKLRIFPAVVQGEGSAKSIAKQINYANKFNLCDVLIVGRGGGSLEDLLPFSDELVIEAIYNSKIPVISAVGHEVDYALSDYAADLRAPTPSAAAELVTKEQSELLNKVYNLNDSIILSMERIIALKKEILKRCSVETLTKNLRSTYVPSRIKTDELRNTLIKNFKSIIDNAKYRVNIIKTSIEKESPYYILEKGYTIITDKNDKIVKSANLCKKDLEVTINFVDGKKGAIIK